jgi:thiamine biosynthesis lipoprotein ApbE
MPAKKIFNFKHEAMSTFFEVFISGYDEAYSRSAGHEFFREIDRLERLLSRFDPGSEISIINRLSPGEGLPVGVETFECLKAGFELMVATGGAFNLNYRAQEKAAGKQDFLKMGKNTEHKKEENKFRVEGKGINKLETNQKENKSNHNKIKKEAVEKWKKKEKPEEQTENTSSESKSIVRTSGEIESNLEEGVLKLALDDLSPSEVEPWQKIFPLEILKIQGGYLAVRLKVPGAELDLDLGAIGKGYALEKAAQIFSEWEISDFLVNAGGSTVYARGKRPWSVAVGRGFDFIKSGKISLRNRALSGSGHEVKGEHIFDPRTKEKKSRQLQVWVLHPSPTMADGLSTAFMVMSLDEIAAYCQNHPEVWALVLSGEQKSFMFGKAKI